MATFIKDHRISNPDCRHYHTHEALCSDGEFAPPMQAEICGLPGVNSCLVFRHYVHVMKSPAFTWDEVSPAIEKLLRCFDLRVIS